MRKSLAVKSSIVGLITKLLTIVLSIISTRLFMHYLGVEIKGISGLIANMLSLLQMAEMGIGIAIINALYQPLVDNKREEIKSLMAFYKKAYRYIGLLIFAIGCIVSLFLKFFIKDIQYTWEYVYIIFFIQLLASVSTYLLGAYKRNLLYADQKQYISVIIDGVVNTVFVLIRMGVIVYLRSYVIYILLQVLQTVVSNLIISLVVNKKYPYLNEKNVLKYDKMPELISNVKNVIIGKIGGVVYNSTDNLIVSKFVGIIAVGYLSNYYTIKTIIRMITSSITEPIRPMIGNYIREYQDVTKAFKLFLSYTFVRYCLANVVVVGFMTLINPFIDIWLGKEYTMPILIPIFIAIDIYIDIVHGPTWEFINVLGLFRNDRNMSYIGALINLITSIGLVLIMGVPGVLLGTVIAQCYYWSARGYIVFKQYFKNGAWEYAKRVILYTIVLVADILLMMLLRFKIMPTTTIPLFILLVISSIGISLMSICLIWGRSEEFGVMLNMMKMVVRRENDKN